MTDDKSQDEAIRQIIQNCQELFLYDTGERLDHIHSLIDKWENGELTGNKLAQSIHEHIHIIKGMALTVQFESIHFICLEILHTFKQQWNGPWPREEVLQLIRNVKLIEAVFNDEKDSSH